MDKSDEGRMNRSLAIHSLENLVFEKRQRKPVSQAPLPTFNKPHVHKIKHKKNTNKDKSAKNEEKESKEKLKEKEKAPAITKRKEVKVQRKKGKELKRKNIRKALKIPQAHPRKEEKDKLEASELKNAHKVEQKDEKEEINPNVQEGEAFEFSKKSAFVPLVLQEESPPLDQSSDQIRIPIPKSPEKNIILNDKPKKGRGRPRKQRPQTQNEIQPKVEEVQVQSQEKDERPDSKEKDVAVDKIDQPSLPAEGLEPAKINYNDYMPETRVRRAKFNPMISYNQNDDQLNSDESYQTSRDARRKKKIGKGSRNRYRTNQPYKLNRIFRKEAKKAFACFQVQADLNTLLIQDFVKQFGVFDLVHFSLPLKFLHFFPSMPLIMEKGFVFLWADQKETQIGYHLLNRWGYDVIDQIVWIKSNQQEGKIEADNVDPSLLLSDSQDKTTELFINMKSTCLVGYKCPLGNKAEYRTKVSNNIIFATTGRGCSKPSQIYEIADLMMPGGKKLEFGGSSQKGWLNLRHNETTLTRCHKCFKEQELFFLHQASSDFMQCQKCLVDELISKTVAGEVQNLKEKLNQIPKTKISQISYDSRKSCSQCKIDISKVEKKGLIKPTSSEDSFCFDCFRKVQENFAVADIISKKTSFYNTASLKCCECSVEVMYDKYFECPKNKNLKLCQQCFWKAEDPPEDLGEDQQKKSSPKAPPQWRLKFIKNYPLMKFSCFSCKRDLSLPFWSCQTCQSWSWCGYCDRGSSDVHPHYQNGGHQEYLIV